MCNSVLKTGRDGPHLAGGRLRRQVCRLADSRGSKVLWTAAYRLPASPALTVGRDRFPQVRPPTLSGAFFPRHPLGILTCFTFRLFNPTLSVYELHHVSSKFVTVFIQPWVTHCSGRRSRPEILSQVPVARGAGYALLHRTDQRVMMRKRGESCSWFATGCLPFTMQQDRSKEEPWRIDHLAFCDDCRSASRARLFCPGVRRRWCGTM